MTLAALDASSAPRRRTIRLGPVVVASLEAVDEGCQAAIWMKSPECRFLTDRDPNFGTVIPRIVLGREATVSGDETTNKEEKTKKGRRRHQPLRAGASASQMFLNLARREA